MTPPKWRPTSIEEVEDGLTRESCDLCPTGWHLKALPPRTITCHICPPLPSGEPRTHHHRRLYPRRAIQHRVHS